MGVYNLAFYSEFELLTSPSKETAVTLDFTVHCNINVRFSMIIKDNTEHTIAFWEYSWWVSRGQAFFNNYNWT